MKTFRLTRWFAFLFLLVLSGAAWAGPIRGQVLDAQTRQPIKGAIVLGVWTRIAGLPGLHHTELVGVKETETDEQGQFTLEKSWSFGVNEEAITIYKFGYVAWSNLFIFPTSERRKDNRVPAQILLERFPPGENHQRHMAFIRNARLSGMGYGIESMPKLWNALKPELNMP